MRNGSNTSSPCTGSLSPQVYSSTLLKLCANTVEPVTAVASLAGFQNLGHFHAEFRRRCGMSPAKFRKAARAETPFPRVIDERRGP